MANLWQPRVPAELETGEYAVPEDRRGLQRLRTLVPLVLATRMYLKHLGEPLIRAQLLGGGVRVTERQFPAIHQLVTACARVLHMEPPEVFVVQHPVLNAYTYGHQKAVVVLNSGLVDAMSEAELAFTLGHEFGHVKSEHVLFLNLAEFLRTNAPPALQWVAAPAVLSLFAWQRYAELTADRAGFIACQQLDDAQAALIKLALGSRQLFEQLDVEEYLRQTRQLENLPARLAVAFQGHPYTASRVAALGDYAASSDYAALWRARGPRVAAPLPLFQRLGRAAGRTAAELGSYGRDAASLVKDRARTALRAVPVPDVLLPPSSDRPLPTARPDEEPI